MTHITHTQKKQGVDVRRKKLLFTAGENAIYSSLSNKQYGNS